MTPPDKSLIVPVFKHLMAPVVSFFVSWIVFFLGVFVFAFLGLWPGPFVIIVFTAVGFCGVFSGTLALPRTSRRVGSGVLLLLGLAFFCCMANVLADAPDDSEGRPTATMSPFVLCIPLVAGGLLAAFLFWWPPRKKSLQPRIHAPVGSELILN